jgi:hypothetical protein
VTEEINREQLKDTIVTLTRNGIKAMQLIAEEDLAPYLASHQQFDLNDIFEELVTEGRIIEIEYVLPNKDRIKSFFLPVGTEIRVRDFSEKEKHA